ncbi:neurobeachin/beige-like protein [Trypanosoma grayi]|uniref:neurobeachin/beige-like protein n=1 Tax=Trypanosoma grayi TaxID=71804 RepID=UPI0004F40813|nr:neurobeachin/beige-like protein [Trypanosoma grayi]KEG13324.1 neurobeachin/beige-like protein [Trypanosoma grayi]
MVSLGTASVPAGNQPVPLLFGALGMFGGPLSRVEASCLFVMGSDSLLSLSFMDKSFVVGLYPALANMVQQEESVLTDEIVLLSAMWRRRGISGAEDQVMFSGAVMPFSRYYNRERFPIVVGVRNGGLYLEANAERRGITGDTLERHEPDSASLNPSPGRVAKNKLVMPVSLMLSNDENEIRILGSIWARVNGPRFHSVSPVYSVLDAVGGIPFFAWLVSLQPTYSEAFEEAWKCVGDVILWHSTDNLLCCTPLHGGRHLVVLLKAMLHSRVVISKKTAVSLCRAVGNRMIVRTDLLPLLLDFTLWSQNSGGFQAVLHKLQEYVVDDQYGAFNSRILQNGVDSQYGADHSYALEEFLVHLLMHFAGDTNGDWDVSLISSATVFLATLCRTPLHMRRMVQAAICLVVGEDALASSVVDWALGLLSAVRQSMSVINPGSLDDEFLVSDIVTLLKCSKEVVRCNALSLLSWALISKEQLDTMVDEYLARKALFPDTLCISEAELCTVVCVVEQSARRGDTKGARTLLVFLVALLQHIPCDYQMRVVVLLCNVAKEKGPLIRDLVYPTDFSEKGFASIVSYLLGVLLILAKNEVTVTGLLVESLTSVAVYMIEVSWSTEGVNCGRALRDVVLTIFLAVSCLNDIEPRRRLELSDNKVNVLVSRFVVSSLDKFSILAGKGCSGSFMDDYVSFLQIAATAVILLDWCESNCRSSDESMVKKKEDDQGDTWVSQTLAGVYFSSFGKPLCLGDRHTVVRIALLLFECARKLLFELQAGQSGTLPRKRVKRLSEELLLLQWRVAASLLYNAEQNDDDVVRELTLLYLVYGGNAECSFNTPALAKQGALTQPPGGADWRLLRSSSNTVMSELLKRAPGEALKESAPWLIVLRAASSFLHPSLQGNQHRFSMALSVCQFVRYHAAVWSLVKGGASTSSLAELDAALKIDSGVPDAARSATLSNPLWDIELSRNGVATLERFLVTARASAFSMLRRCSAQSPPPLLFAEPRRAVQRRGQISADMHQFQASLWKKVTLYKKFVEEDGCAILASHAAYRFSLLPWWGQCINLYARTPVPLNRWELDRFLGTEWQHVRLRRFIHDVKITDAWSTDQLLRAVYKKDMAPTDDVRLLKLYSVTALPQLQATCVSGTYAFTVGCKLVLPMDRVPIVLCIASKHISYVVERFQHGLTQLGKEPSATSFDLHGGGTSTKVEVHNPISRFPKTFRCKCEIPCVRRVVDVSSVRAIWKRRNLLQPCALELLLSTGETLFLAFETEEMRRRVSAAIIAVTRPYLDKTLVMTESNLRMWRNWWCEGRITNFHYLMYLNFAAGRSYGDLRQYPVFPHVVADYLSDTLDLTNAASFRRFSKPMGAQTPDREQKAIAKYMEIAALGGTGQTMSIDLIPHHYGSHYSPLGGALHFLVRVQPFSDYFVNMNSKLDDADRVFDSMATAYTISTGKDVKEMLPEFYCLPDMFVNFNHIPFGTKQDGDIVNDVQLPPWASAPRELTQMLRQALESRYTSENLHSWIDLTFGYKQRGKEAIAAVNVFHPLTYERSIDLLAITDPVLKSSHETQIDCFGQTPSQLFSHPHKPRGKPTDPPFFQSPCPTLRYEASSWRFCVVLHPEQLVPMSSHRVDGTVVVFARSRSATAARGAEEGSEWKFPLTQARPVVLPKGCFPFTVTNDQLKDCLCIRGNGIVLVDGKDVSRDICTFHMSYGRVTTLAVDPPIVYVGMDSGAIHLMKITNEELNEVELPLEDENGQRADLTDTAERILRGEVRTTRTRSAVRRRLCVLYGHTAPVTTLFVSHEWGILVSSAEDYIVGVWDIERHILIRTISYPKLSAKYPDSLLTENIGKQWCGGEVWHYSLIAVNAKEGDIILAGHSLKKTYAVRLYSLNGSFVASYDLGKEPATALLSVGGVIFVAQGTTVRVLKESNMQWICDVTHSSIEDGIESLALDPGATILAACSRKSTLVTWRVVPSG